MKISWGSSIDAFKRTLALNTKKYNKDVQKAVDDTADDILQIVKRLTPVKTGRLKRSWRLTRRRRARNRVVDIFNDVPYAPMVEHGTSRQAPKKMLEKSLRRGAKIMKRRLTYITDRSARSFNQSG